MAVSEYYFPLMEEDKAKCPPEIKYLAVVKQNRSIRLSTKPAYDHMYNIYFFGDWDLVLAAYNLDQETLPKPSDVLRGQQNYWNIEKNLPEKHKVITSLFLATMYTIPQRTWYCSNRAKVKHFATDTVMIKRQMTFRQISELDVPVAQLQL
jgi:membrane-bound lytic murein transglycosylase D